MSPIASTAYTCPSFRSVLEDVGVGLLTSTKTLWEGGVQNQHMNFMKWNQKQKGLLVSASFRILAWMYEDVLHRLSAQSSKRIIQFSFLAASKLS